MKTEIHENFRGLGSEIKSVLPKLEVGSKAPLNDPFVDKMKRWLLVGLTFLVMGGAALLIVIKIIGRIFG